MVRRLRYRKWILDQSDLDRIRHQGAGRRHRHCPERHRAGIPPVPDIGQLERPRVGPGVCLARGGRAKGGVTDDWIGGAVGLGYYGCGSGARCGVGLVGRVRDWHGWMEDAGWGGLCACPEGHVYSGDATEREGRWEPRLVTISFEFCFLLLTLRTLDMYH